MHITAEENHTGIHSSQNKITCSDNDLKVEMQGTHLPHYFSFAKTFGATCVA